MCKYSKKWEQLDKRLQRRIRKKNDLVPETIMNLLVELSSLLRLSVKHMFFIDVSCSIFQWIATAVRWVASVQFSRCLLLLNPRRLNQLRMDSVEVNAWATRNQCDHLYETPCAGRCNKCIPKFGVSVTEAMQTHDVYILYFLRILIHHLTP